MKPNKLLLVALTILSLCTAACSRCDSEPVKSGVDSGVAIDSGATTIDSGVAIDSGAATIDSGTQYNGSGVDGSKALTDLDAAEKLTVCDYVETLISDEENQKFYCILAGLSFSSIPDECQMAYDACLANPDETNDKFDCPLGENPPDCAANVTVADIEACAHDRADKIIGIANGVNCASMGSEVAGATDLPPSCQTLLTNCPDLFNDDES